MPRVAAPRAFIAVLALGLAATAAEPPIERHLLIDAEVDVAADGRVDAVRFLGEVDPRIAALLEPQARQTRFAPQPPDGGASIITTFVRYSACLRAEDGALSVAMHYLAHGPLARQGAIPPVPVALIRGREGRYSMALTYSVRPDGSAALEDVDWGDVPGGARRAAESDYRKWFARTRYLAERVDGQPVATRMKLPMDISIHRSGGPRTQPPQPSCDALRSATQSPQVLAGPLQRDVGAAGEG